MTSELSIVSRKHVLTIPAAIKALDLMQRELDSPKTYEQIIKVIDAAEALKLLFKDVEIVKAEAEDVVIAANIRIGEQIKKVPKAGNRFTAEGKSGRGSTGIPGTTRSRYTKLAEEKDQVKEVVDKLRKEGKDVTPTAVHREITQGDKKESRSKREQELAEKILSMPDKEYGVIYADPPWKFEPYSRETGMDRAADNHYPTMNLQKIMDLEIPAADDCILFLWATSPMLIQALEVMEAWNFEYKSHCIWVKDKIGTGYWFRNKHEILLIGTKGKIPAPAPGEQYESVITAPSGKHSSKPFAFREMIEDMFPKLPRIELFAREEFDGWDTWGNEA